MRIVLVVMAIVVGCKGKEPAPASGSGAGTANQDPMVLAMPEVALNGYDRVTAPANVVASPLAIQYQSKHIANVVDLGGVDALPTLTAAVASAPQERVLIAIDKQLPFRLFVQIVTSAKRAGVKSFGLLAEHEKQRLVVPLDLPDKASSGAKRATGPTASGRSGVKLAFGEVTVTPESSLTSDAVKAKIMSAYRMSLVRCLQDPSGPKLAPSLLLTLTFDIETSGKAITPVAKGAANEVTDCIVRLVTGWRFAIAKNNDGAPVAVKVKAVVDAAYEEAAPAPDPVAPAPMAPMPPMSPEDVPVGMVVAITKKEILVGSVSGLEGTLAMPRLSVEIGSASAVAKVTSLLEEVVKQRWAGKAARPEHDRQLILMADSATPMQTIAEILGAVRAAPSGTELFPNVLLSVGFE